MFLRILYLLATLGVLSSFDIFWDYPMVHSISKGLLMPILIAMVILQGKECKARLFLIGALVCSWAGDLFLLSDDESFFLAGLSAFLVAHILYIITFRKAREDNHEIPATSKLPLFLLLVSGNSSQYFPLPSKLPRRDGTARASLHSGDHGHGFTGAKQITKNQWEKFQNGVPGCLGFYAL